MNPKFSKKLKITNMNKTEYISLINKHYRNNNDYSGEVFIKDGFFVINAADNGTSKHYYYSKENKKLIEVKNSCYNIDFGFVDLIVNENRNFSFQKITKSILNFKNFFFNEHDKYIMQKYLVMKEKNSYMFSKKYINYYFDIENNLFSSMPFKFDNTSINIVMDLNNKRFCLKSDKKDLSDIMNNLTFNSHDKAEKLKEFFELVELSLDTVFKQKSSIEAHIDNCIKDISNNKLQTFLKKFKKIHNLEQEIIQKIEGNSNNLYDIIIKKLLNNEVNELLNEKSRIKLRKNI